MGKRLQTQGLGLHPKLERIVDAKLKGESSRQISTWVTPEVSHEAISRYFRTHVTPVVRNAVELNKLLKTNRVENQELNRHHSVAPVQEVTQQDVKQALLAAPILAIRENRIKLQADRHERLKSIMEERSAAPGMAGVPGGKSGLLVTKYKKFGTEYEIDSVLLAELREHEKMVAIETGQWQENAGAASVSIQVVCPSTADGAPRITFASNDTIDYNDIGLLQKPV